MKSLSVVIPNYNGYTLLQKNLPSIYAAIHAAQITQFEIIISDDASSDESASFIQQHYPDILFVQNTGPKGFAPNTNNGIRLAQKDLVFILNNDVKLDQEYFIPQLAYFSHADTFGVMGKIKDYEGHKVIDTAKYPALSFDKINSTINFEYTAPDQETFTLFLSGANALVDREKLMKVGAFEEIYSPYYSEDVDLGLKAWRMGYRLYYEPKAVCYHEVSATTKKAKRNNTFVISRRNKIHLHHIHLSAFGFSIYLLRFVFKALGLMILKWDNSYWKALSSFLTHYEKSVATRQKINQLTKAAGGPRIMDLHNKILKGKEEYKTF
jgi:GT2 family glycosyltransferase